MSEMKTFAEMTSQERIEFAEEQPKILTKLIKSVKCDKYYPNDSDDDGENEFADNAFSNDSENEYADEESSKKEWDMTYIDIIFFILGYIQKNKIEFGKKQQQFIQFCYFKMKFFDYDCSDCGKKLREYPINYNVNEVDKNDLEHFYRLYKDIRDKWEQFLNHIHQTNIGVPPNFNYTDCFYNDKFGLVEKQT